MKLTPKEQYCLEYLKRHGPTPNVQICKAAHADGVNTSRQRFEWADAPLRSLRKKGLAYRSVEKADGGYSSHGLTDAGKELR
jgi:hypothetical protein